MSSCLITRGDLANPDLSQDSQNKGRRKRVGFNHPKTCLDRRIFPACLNRDEGEMNKSSVTTLGLKLIPDPHRVGTYWEAIAPWANHRQDMTRDLIPNDVLLARFSNLALIESERVSSITWICWTWLSMFFIGKYTIWEIPLHQYTIHKMVMFWNN